MEMVLQLLLLVLGFVMLVKGADWFVDGAASIASKFGIPQLVIGLTIVAMGTSAPEAAVSITAAFAGNADITIGNIVGSNILNILIILGLTALIYPCSIQKSTLAIDIPVTIFASALLLVLGLDGNITRLDAIIMLVVFVSYLTYLLISAKKERTASLQAEQKESSVSEQTEETQIKEMSLLKAILFTLIGLVLIIAGSKFVVSSASFIATKLGLSTRFIGLTIVALGTSLPELFTSVTAAMKKNSDIAIGNIVGSNIFNILFIVGLTAVIIPVPFAETFMIDIIVCLASALLLFICVIKTKKLHRWAGVLMLITYVAYFVYLLV